MPQFLERTRPVFDRQAHEGAADRGEYCEAAGAVALDPTVASCSRTSNSREARSTRTIAVYTSDLSALSVRARAFDLNLFWRTLSLRWSSR